MVPVITLRIDAIKKCHEARYREQLAHLLAFGTHFTVEQCARILQAAPYERHPPEVR